MRVVLLVALLAEFLTCASGRVESGPLWPGHGVGARLVTSLTCLHAVQVKNAHDPLLACGVKSWFAGGGPKLLATRLRGQILPASWHVVFDGRGLHRRHRPVLYGLGGVRSARSRLWIQRLSSVAVRQHASRPPPFLV